MTSESSKSEKLENSPVENNSSSETKTSSSKPVAKAKTPAKAAPKKKVVKKKVTKKAAPAEAKSDDSATVEEKPKKVARPRKAKKTVPTKAKSVATKETDTVVGNTTVAEAKPAKPAVKKPVRPRKSTASKAKAKDKVEAVTVDTKEVKVETASEDIKEAKAPVKAKKAPAKKRAPRKPKAPVETPKDIDGNVSAPVEKTAETPSANISDAEGNKINEQVDSAPIKKKPARRRPQRKPKKQPAKDVSTEIDVEQVVAETVVKETQEAKPVADAAPTTQANNSEEQISTGEAVAEDTSPQTQNKRQPRRRGRRSSKKPVLVSVGDKGVDSNATNQDDAQDVSDADTIQPEKPGKPKQWTSAKEEPVKAKNVRLLINAEEPEECRLALLEDGKLQSIHVSTVNRAQTKSNIYKAKIVAIEPNLQAAFIDYGTNKNGFLPFSEIHPEYYKDDVTDTVREHIEARRWRRLKLEDVMERGQEMLVQVVKEEVGKKGANMTTYLSLPGRCVVLMPGSDSTGISRKITGEERRGKLRDIMRSFDIPSGIGWIVRTASVDINENALSRDVEYLLKLWEDIRGKGQSIEGVGLAYEDHRTVLRFLREHFDPSIQEITVDAQPAYEQVLDFVDLLPSDQKSVNVRLHKGTRPIFNQFSVEDQIESIYQPQVNLPSGGSIVIDPTEALVAIDVNSGSTSKGKNFEESIFQANMEAASELARQLRLRDLGGLIVVDFIDMRNKRHVREVEKEVRIAMKRDKAKVDFSRISKFGLMQISRQKLGSPIEAGAYHVCQHCKGRGTVRAVETQALFYLRRIQTGASRNPVVKVECHFPLDVASYLLNNKRRELHELETKYSVEIVIIAEGNFKPAENEIIFHRQEKEKIEEK